MPRVSFLYLFYYNCPPLGLSVCPIRPRQQRAAGLLLWPGGQVISIDSGAGASAPRAAATTGRATLSADAGS